MEVPGAVGLPEVGGDAGDDAGWRGVAGPDEERSPEERRAAWEERKVMGEVTMEQGQAIDETVPLADAVADQVDND